MDSNQIQSELSELFSFIPQTLTTIAVIIFMLVVAIIIGLRFKKYKSDRVNSKFQVVIEMMYDYFYDITESMLGEKYAISFTPLSTVMFLSVFLGNIVGIFMFPKESALINPIFTFTWSISMFIIWTVYGMYKTGFRSWVKNGLVGEMWQLAPIETLGYLTKPISLGARMLGNISAGAIIVMLIWAVPQLIVSFFDSMVTEVFVGVIGVTIFSILGGGLSLFFSLFGPFIQATVFTYLTLSYFAGLLPEEE